MNRENLFVTVLLAMQLVLLPNVLLIREEPGRHAAHSVIAAVR